MRREERERSRSARGSLLGEESFGFFKGVSFATSRFREAFIEIRVDGFLIAEQPIFLSSQYTESLGDEFVGILVDTAIQFALEKLLGFGIECERHGGSITLDDRAGMRQIGLYFESRIQQADR